jgi:hypothetical protein
MSLNLKSKAFLFGSLLRQTRQNSTKILASSHHVYSKSLRNTNAILLLKANQVIFIYII